MARGKIEKRGQRRRKIKPVILIVTEGSQTEPKYFEHYRNRQTNIDIRVVGSRTSGGETDYLSLIRKAVEYQNKNQISVSEGDSVWVVADGDVNYNNPDPITAKDSLLSKARKMADAKGIQIALSNPCFEFWYLLHFQYTTKFFKDYPAVKNASVSGAYTAQDTFVAKIVDLNEHIPPDPVATDTNPGYSVPPLPSETQKLTANWGVWSCYWVPVWVWCDHGEDGGHWVDEGYWEYEYTGYSASISGEMSLMPDDIVPTASGKTMKSGYGVKTEVRATLSTDAPTSHITYPQTAFSVFPEFQYQTYLRLLQRSGGQSAKFIFKPNEFSTYDRTVHFTPLWFPDATDYTIYTQVWDTWTPDGMLSINLNDYVSIQGSLYDDWYTNRE